MADYKKWGFSDQSSIVREALERFMREIKIRERKDMMKKRPMNYWLTILLIKNSPFLLI